LGDQRIHVARPVVAVLGEIAKHVGIGAAGLQQLLRHLVHFSEAVVAQDEVQVLVGVDQSARHVVEGNLELPLYDSRLVIGQMCVRQSRHQHPSCSPARPCAVNADVTCDNYVTLASSSPCAKRRGSDARFTAALCSRLFGLCLLFSPIFFTHLLNRFVLNGLTSVQGKADTLEIQGELAQARGDRGRH